MKDLFFLAVFATGVAAQGAEGLLEGIEKECIAVVERAQPGVVQVVAERRGLVPAVQAKGSGLVWNDEGLVVTSSDSVGESKHATVVDAKGRRITADVLGQDPVVGVAVLRARFDGDPLVPVRHGDARLVKPGSILFVVGNANDFRGTISFGIASGVDRTIRVGPFVQRGLLQTTAPINPGDSGGALVNIRGELVGMVLASFNRAPSMAGLKHYAQDLRAQAFTVLPGEGGQGWNLHFQLDTDAHVGSEGVGFAVPVHRLSGWVDEILARGRVRRAWFGLTLREATEAERLQLSIPAGRGLVVQQVVDGSPSAKAGIQPHDIFISIGENELGTLDDLYAVREDALPESKVLVLLKRKGRDERVEIILGEVPEGEFVTGDKIQGVQEGLK